MFILASYSFQKRIDTYYIKSSVAISKIIASQLDAEKIDNYLETLEKDEEYERTLDYMRLTVRETDVLYIYVSKFVENGEIFVFDTDESEDRLELGDFENWVEGDYDLTLLPRLIRGEQIKPHIMDTPKWGSLLTMHEPIYRADRSVAAYASVDVSMDKIMKERKIVFASIGLIILFTFFITIMANLYIIQKIAINPLNSLIEDVSLYNPGTVSKESLEHIKSGLKMHLGDEFTILKHAVLNMELHIEDTMERIKHQEKMLRALNEMAVALLSQENGIFDDVMNKGLKPIAQMAKLDRIAVYKFLGKKGTFGQVYLYGKTVPLENELQVILVEPPVTHWIKVLAKGGHINANVKEMPDIEADWLSRFGVKSIFFVPIFMQGEFWGVITLEDHSTYRYFDNESLEMLRSTAHLCANSVVRDEMNREMVRLESEVDKIYIDALTGIHNRRFFDENRKGIISTLSRSKGWLSVMMIDIDHFKKFNDTYGHSEGDKCLKSVAKTLAKTVARASDSISRYGGEEFIVVLPNTNEIGARTLAEKFICNVLNCKIPHEKNTAADYVTISIGVTSGQASYSQSMSDYVNRADEMLYISKRDGRNRYNFKAL